MEKFNYTITDEIGLHARPAGLLVKKVKEMGVAVNVSKGEKTVDASRLMAVMSLGVKYGETIEISVEDSAKAAELKKFFEENL